MVLEKGNHTWPLGTALLRKGLYFVQVHDDQGNSNVLTLIKQ
jgi:hypothetical protein